jgi:hypothetical protein
MPLMVSMLKITLSSRSALSPATECRAWRSCRRGSYCPIMSRKRRNCRTFPAHVEAFLHAQLFLHAGSVLLVWTFNASVAPIFRARSSRYGIHVRDHHVARARVFAPRAAAMMPMGPAPVISTSSPSTGKRQRRMHRVAEWIEDGRDVAVDALRCAARRWSWAAKCTRRTRPAGSRRRPGWLAQMPPAGQAVAAAAADHVAFSADNVAGKKSFTLEPTSTISPTNSWPTTMGTGMVFCAHSSHL